ncbi:MAG: ABC transporter substrate-binding protein [Eubacteriales bacterium]|nr:ABC transporter substrate-binding protein [Eubacteriales bacterium]
MKKRWATKVMACAAAAAMAVSMTACYGVASTDSSSSSGDAAATETSDSADGTASEAAADGQTVISLYTTLPGKDAEFEELVNDFMAANPDVKVNYIAYDSSEKQKWMTLYAGGQAPTVSIMDAIDILENQESMVAFDPATEESLQGIDSMYTDVFKGDDGQIYGVPDTVTAMGIIYNKTTIENATGEEFDPSTIKSLSDLRALCEKIQAGGVAPLMLTGVDWSLGSHYLSQVFTGIRGDAQAQSDFINEIKAGNVDLKTDSAWNSVMDTFDLFAEYNYNAKDPLVGNTDIDGQAIANGEVAMYFMGDWGWDYIKDLAKEGDEYGLMPVPLTDNADDAINSQIGAFPAKGFCVDKSQNNEAQQEAGKRLITFILKGESQKFADLVGTALPFEASDVTYSNPLAESVKQYIADGNTYSTYAFSALLPSDFWSENGATMQQYLAGQIDRDGAADAIQAYWQSQN